MTEHEFLVSVNIDGVGSRTGWISVSCKRDISEAEAKRLLWEDFEDYDQPLIDMDLMILGDPESKPPVKVNIRWNPANGE